MKELYSTYTYRIKGILIAVISIVSAALSCFVLFGGKINRISAQLQSYANSDYSYIYELNYPLNTSDEYIYAYTNIILYEGSDTETRIPVTVLMQNAYSDYSEEYLGCSTRLGINEIVVSENVALNHNLSVGNTILAEYPNSNELYELVVTEISKTNYSFENPNVDNEIGVVILGYNEQYAVNTENKTLCFSKNSLSQEISTHPQILDSIINKTTNMEYVFSQGLSAIFFEGIALILAVLISELFFYRNTIPIIRRFYLKGMSVSWFPVISIVEHLLFSLIPLVISIMSVCLWIQCNSIYVELLIALAVSIVLISCLVSGIRSIILCSNIRGVEL